jgi:hypothetical protein
MEPKNSLEALDNLVHCKSETKCKECHHKNVCTLERDYNIVKQDLIQQEQDIQDVIADYQDAARKMFKYVEAIEKEIEILVERKDAAYLFDELEFCNIYNTTIEELRGILNDV